VVVWILLAAALLGLVVLTVAVTSPLARLRHLRRAMRRLQQRRTDAGVLQEKAVALQDRLAALGRGATQAQDRIAVIAAKGRD
jgi:biopolymer transport protein ExbB/TolQ